MLISCLKFYNKISFTDLKVRTILNRWITVPQKKLHRQLCFMYDQQEWIGFICFVSQVMRGIMSHALFLWMKLMPLVCVINLVITLLALRENDLSKLEDFSTTLTVLCLNNFVACVVGAKRGGGGRKALKLSLPNPPPFFPSSLSPTPFRHLLCRLTTLAISWCCRWV